MSLKKALLTTAALLMFMTPAIAQEDTGLDIPQAAMDGPGVTTAPAPAVAPAPAATAPATTTPAAAPAAAGAGASSWMSYKSPYSGEQNDLSNPHRTAEEILGWSDNMAADALSFSPEAFNEKLTGIKTSFSAQGWTEYSNYLRQSKMVDFVRNQKYGVSTIVDGSSVITGSGASAGVYQWAVAINLIVSYVRSNAEGEQETMNSTKYRLTMVLARSLTAGNTDGIAVQSWNMQQR